jgi:AAA+ ATPase superfamily predicted ATPase
MFVGREAELGALNKAYSREGFQLAIVYGRRRADIRLVELADMFV